MSENQSVTLNALHRWRREGILQRTARLLAG
jgi:hypothetical protein